MASVSYAAGDSFPDTSGRRARRTAAAKAGRVARLSSSWCRISITPRPSSAAFNSSSACSTAVRSESVACCSSRSFSGRLELKRIASIAAETSLICWMHRLHANGAEALLLAHSDERPAEQLEYGDKRHDRLQAVFGFQDQLHQLDGAPAEAVGDQVELLLQRPRPARDDQGPRRDAREHAVEGD